MPDRLPGAVGKQQRPTAHRLDPLGQQVREEHRKIDHALATVLRRPEEPARMHILVHRPELCVDLVDAPADTDPCRLQAKSPGAHRAHLAPPHPGERRDDHHERLLRRQPRPHRQNRTQVHGHTDPDRLPLAGPALPNPGRGRRRNQPLGCSIDEQIADHAHRHRHARRRQTLLAQAPGEL